MKLDPETVDRIGVWVLRILLATGSIVAALMGLDDAAGVMAVVLVLSFFFL